MPKGQYKLTSDRLAEIDKIPFPTTVKSTQSFLGGRVFCQPFVPNQGQHAAHLHDMAKKGFSFPDRSTWTKDYESLFNDFKRALAQLMAIHFPNYELDLRCLTDRLRWPASPSTTAPRRPLTGHNHRYRVS